MSATKITHEHIDGIAERIAAAPVPARPLTTVEAVQRLLPTLAKMQRAGHTPDSLSATLQTEGLQVSARSLARMLRTGKTRRRASGSTK